MKSSFKLFIAIAAVTALAGGAAKAQLLYNVDLNAGGSVSTESTTYSGAAILGSDGDSWNGVVILGSSNTYTLTDSTGAASDGTLGLSFLYYGLGSFGYTAGGGSNTPVPSTLMGDYYYINGGGQSTSNSADHYFTITGLTVGATFTFVDYSASNNGGSSSYSLLWSNTVGGVTTDTSFDSQSTTGDTANIYDPDALGAAYNTYTGVVASSTLIFDLTSGVSNGFQLSESVPEPSVWAMLVGGILLLFSILRLRTRNN